MRTEAVDPEETARRILGAEPSDGSLYLLGTTGRQLFAFAQARRAVGEGPTLRVLSDREPLRRLREDFPVAARAAECVEQGSLALREGTLPVAGAMAVGDERVYAPVTAEGASAHVAGDGSFRSVARAACREWWASGEPFDLRTPPLSGMREATLETFGSAVWADYETTLDAAAGLRDRSNFDAVAAGVLIGARHRLAQREVARWAEDVGLASRATVSRTKNALADDGVVTTDPAAGRRRQRLLLTDEYAAMADEHGVAEVIVRIVV